MPSSRRTTPEPPPAPAGRRTRRPPAEPLPPVKLLLTPYPRGGGGRGAPRRPRAPARRAPDRGVARLRPRAGAAPARRLQPVHGRRHAALRGPGPRRAADDRVVGIASHKDWKVDDIQDRGLAALARAGDQGPGASGPIAPGPEKARSEGSACAPDLLWMIRVVGALAIVRRGRPAAPGFHRRRRRASPRRRRPTGCRWSCAVAELVRGVMPEPRALVYSVSLNREASPTVVAVDAGHQGRRRPAPLRHLLPGPDVGGHRQRHRRPAPGVSPARPKSDAGEREAVRRREGTSPPTAPASSRRTTSRRSTSCSTRTPEQQPAALTKRLQGRLRRRPRSSSSSLRSSTAP